MLKYVNNNTYLSILSISGTFTVGPISNNNAGGRRKRRSAFGENGNPLPEKETGHGNPDQVYDRSPDLNTVDSESRSEDEEEDPLSKYYQGPTLQIILNKRIPRDKRQKLKDFLGGSWHMPDRQ